MTLLLQVGGLLRVMEGQTIGLAQVVSMELADRLDGATEIEARARPYLAARLNTILLSIKHLRQTEGEIEDGDVHEGQTEGEIDDGDVHEDENEGEIEDGDVHEDENEAGAGAHTGLWSNPHTNPALTNANPNSNGLSCPNISLMGGACGSRDGEYDGRSGGERRHHSEA